MREKKVSVTPGERRDQGHAITALNALSAGLEPRVRSRVGLVEHPDAMEALTEHIKADRLGVPRLRVLDALVKLARRRPRDFQRDDPRLRGLLEALVIHAGVPAETQPAATDAVAHALETVAHLSIVAPTQDAWKTFAHQAQGPLGLTAAEVDKPRCNDRQIVVKDGHSAVGVTVEFHTDATPGQMTVCDPTTWHVCTPSFHEMKKWDKQGAIDEQRVDGWRRDLYEVLDFMPGLTLKTPLRFTYSIDQKPSPDWVHLDYVLIEPTEDIAVDEGSIDVRRVANGPHAGRTRVSAKKAICFLNPTLANWPSVACDTFWSDLVVNAAVGCLGDGGEGPISTEGGEVAMPDSKADVLSNAIKEATEDAQKSIEAYGKLAEQAATQLTGDAPVDNAAWARLTAKAFSQAAGDVARSWNLYNEVLRVLANGGQPSTPQPDTKPDG